MCKKQFFWWLSASIYLVAFLVALLNPIIPPMIYGQTQPLSANKPQLSRSSAEHLTAWDKLSAQFEETLKRHEETLTELSVKLKTSENSLEQSTLLLETLSKQNADLKSYNNQIGERMYQRDMDLLAAYEDIDQLEKTRSRLITLAIALGALALALAVLHIRRFFR